MEIKQILQIID